MSSTLKPSPLDWLSFPPTSPSDVHAPHPDLFDLDLEASIIALPQVDQEQLQQLNIDLSDPYAFLATNATPRCGPPSTLTASSESTYDSYSESMYNYSEYESNPTDYSTDLGIDFSRFTVDAAEAKAQMIAVAAQLDATRSNTPNNLVNSDPESVVLGLLPNLEPDVSSSGASNSADSNPGSQNPNNNNNNNNNIFTIPFMSASDIHLRSPYDSLDSAVVAAAFSAHSQPSVADYYPSAIYGYEHLPAAQNTISPTTLLPATAIRLPAMIRSLDHNQPQALQQLQQHQQQQSHHQQPQQMQQQSHSSISPTPSNSNSTASTPPHDSMEQRDPRKKYKCQSCPRAFARAYNLKTHQQTHDPNRLKPHTCPHRACGRSFSRKHDLGRHLVSIHRDETVSTSSSSSAENKGANNNIHTIGVSQGPRGWCDQCGAGWVGKETSCDCRDVK